MLRHADLALLLLLYVVLVALVLRVSAGALLTVIINIAGVTDPYNGDRSMWCVSSFAALKTAVESWAADDDTTRAPWADAFFIRRRQLAAPADDCERQSRCALFR